MGTPPGKISVPDMAEDLFALFEALEIERAHVVGSSMGGAIAQEFAVNHPECVRSLVLSGSFCRPDRYLRKIIESWRFTSTLDLPMRELSNAMYLWCVAPRAYNEHLVDTWLDQAERSEYPQSTEAFIQTIDAVIAHDTTDRLADITMPTMVLYGEHDILIGRRFAEQLCEGLPHVALRELSGVGHVPHGEDPEQFNSALLTFWYSEVHSWS